MSGEELRTKLQSHNVVMADLASRLGMSPQALHSKLNGQEISVSFLLSVADAANINVYEFINKDVYHSNESGESYLAMRRKHKNGGKGVLKSPEIISGIPIYDVPIDASFLERYQDSAQYEPIGFLHLPKLRDCNFGAVVSGSSMYPILKSGTIAACRIVEDLRYFDEGEMYYISTVNGFETVKYVQSTDNPNELRLIPHNEKIKATTIDKSMVIRLCIVEAWINFR